MLGSVQCCWLGRIIFIWPNFATSLLIMIGSAFQWNSLPKSVVPSFQLCTRIEKPLLSLFALFVHF